MQHLCMHSKMTSVTKYLEHFEERLSLWHKKHYCNNLDQIMHHFCDLQDLNKYIKMIQMQGKHSSETDAQLTFCQYLACIWKINTSRN